MSRVSAQVAVFGVLTSAGLFLLTAAPVFADANPNNPGHHYGQLKHPKTTPAPTPLPKPLPSPAATPAPTNRPASVTSPGSASGPGAAVKPVTSPKPAIKASAVPIAFRTPVGKDPLWWLLLAILPTLIAIWLIAVRGVVLGLSSRPRSDAKGAAAPAQA